MGFYANLSELIDQVLSDVQDLSNHFFLDIQFIENEWPVQHEVVHPQFFNLVESSKRYLYQLEVHGLGIVPLDIEEFVLQNVDELFSFVDEHHDFDDIIFGFQKLPAS